MSAKLFQLGLHIGGETAWGLGLPFRTSAVRPIPYTNTCTYSKMQYWVVRSAGPLTVTDMSGTLPRSCLLVSYAFQLVSSWGEDIPRRCGVASHIVVPYAAKEKPVLCVRSIEHDPDLQRGFSPFVSTLVP